MDFPSSFAANEEMYFLDEHVNMRDMFEVISREELTRDVDSVFHINICILQKIPDDPISC